MSKVPLPHSYMVLTETRHIVRQNGKHLLQTREHCSYDYDSDSSLVPTPNIAVQPNEHEPQDNNHDTSTTELTIAEPMPTNEDATKRTTSSCTI